MTKYYDVIVVGGGPGGLAAAASAKQNGAKRVLLLERENTVGGVLNQCIHDGFGLDRFHAHLTGPEYAAYSKKEAVDAQVEIKCGSLVTRIGANRTVTVVSKEGLVTNEAGAIVLATGCRERTRGMIAIPGSRPAGIFTAGVAQNLINCKNIMIGKRIVILGSGDIGLIMARRLSLEGAKILAVVEVMKTPSGLTRNVAQCLHDFATPLLLGHTVSRIFGKKHLTAVEVSKVNESLKVVPGSSWTIECDSLVLSVGLIPENDLAKNTGVHLDRKTNGVLTDAFLQTNIPGIFACGNSRCVMDLVDYVSEQGELAGQNAARYTSGQVLEPWDEERVSGQMRKGVPEPGSVICAMCPKGCQLTMMNGEITGHSCPKGITFGQQEYCQPTRVLTTTMLTAEGRLLPVRTNKAIPKQMMFAVLDACRHKTAPPQCRMGDILVANALDTGADVIACADGRTIG